MYLTDENCCAVCTEMPIPTQGEESLIGVMKLKA